jgi:hypothetical protein
MRQIALREGLGPISSGAQKRCPSLERFHLLPYTSGSGGRVADCDGERIPAGHRSVAAATSASGRRVVQG